MQISLKSRHLWFVLALNAAALLISCNKEKEKEKEKENSARTEKVSDTAPKAPDVRVEDAGTGEKKLLRYRYKAGETVTVRMDMKMNMKIAMGPGQEAAVDMPTMKMKMKIQAREVLSNGNLVYDFSFDSVDLGDDAQLPQTALDNLKKGLEGFLGTQGDAEVTPRGITVKTNLRVPENANPQLKQMMDNFKQQVNQMSVPFPEEAVGVGARWTVTTQMESGGARVTNIYHYTLDSFENDEIQASVKLEQNAPEQEIKNPSLPPGTTVKLLSLESSGSGKVRFDLSSLAPNSEVSSELKMRMRVQAGAQEQEMMQTLQIKVAIQPEK